MKAVPGNKRGCTAPLGASQSGLDVRRRSRHCRCDHEVTALFTTGGGDEKDTIRERAMLRPQLAAYPACRVALYPLSYRCTVHRAGFEPATSRLSVEVTAIFTTDGDGVGGERATLLLPLRAIRLSARRVRTCSALSRLHHEVTDIFTTALTMLAHRQLKGVLGNRRYRSQ